MVKMTQQQRIAEIGKLVGNTPMVKITYKFKGKVNKIFAKLEYYNFSGSIKDRMAFHILSKSYADGLIHPGDYIVE
ncbi:MAG: cysteine synthase A, partial [Bacteroidales bacterium]|nr:cysteine synthase A [Bacteroidales bacterium]